MHRGVPAISRPPGLGRLGHTGLALALAAFTLGLGCSREAGAGDLNSRVRQYMELRQKRDWDAIYEGVLDPSLRGDLKKEKFIGFRKSTFDILGFEVVKTETIEDGSRGSVVARIDALMPIRSPGGGATTVRKKLDDEQTWVLRDGRWYIQLSG